MHSSSYGSAMTPRSAALLWSHLGVLTKDRYDAVLQVFGSLEEAAAHVNEEFLRGLGCRELLVTKTLRRDHEQYSQHQSNFVTRGRHHATPW